MKATMIKYITDVDPDTGMPDVHIEIETEKTIQTVLSELEKSVKTTIWNRDRIEVTEIEINESSRSEIIVPMNTRV